MSYRRASHPIASDCGISDPGLLDSLAERSRFRGGQRALGALAFTTVAAASNAVTSKAVKRLCR